MFELLDPAKTGIAFANTITTDDSLNVQTDVYVYNGAGVAVGDIDNDGLPDIFFAGNMVSSRLYLNKGRMKFDDITTPAHVGTTRWATGATMVDINDDGYLDIYVSVSGPAWSAPASRANLLFVNNHNRTFTEAAAQYGIADTNFTTHAAFLDYDGDGCLDLFLLNNSPQDFSRGVANHPTGMRGETPGSYNQLYRNDCHGRFENVSAKAGILRDVGYGLGVVVADVNGDGRPDIYVSNDGTPNDVLYINRGDGTFANRAAQSLKHTSSAGMGVDIADFNNDGLPDVLQVDMLSPDMARRKRTTGFATYGSVTEARRRGFRDDFTLNALQLNNGVSADGDVVFSEISRMAGVSATDWSWSALFADFDNDGRKDIFIGNGYPKAVNDLDYVNALFATRGRGSETAARQAGVKLLAGLPDYAERSYLFRNAGDLTFTNESKGWGTAPPGFAYGAAYADLDNDGRLDLVVNNIDAPASIYHNVGAQDATHHYLRVTLAGEPPNRDGIGATVIATAGGVRQWLYQSPYRGFMSTVDNRLHFGLGAAPRVDTLQVIWPDGRTQRLTALAADTFVVLRQSKAAKDSTPTPPRLPKPLQRAAHPPPYAPPVDSRSDYGVQALLPYMISNHGPAITIGDVDGDGVDDVFVGGTSGTPGKLFLQKRDGTFAESTREQPWSADKAFDDWGALFFDANGDGRPDLYVASGGYQLAPGSPLLQDRLYINRGAGRFERDAQALPEMLASTAAVRAADFNGDGRLDLFVGGRLTPRDYPTPTRSYILRNDGGRFTDVTAAVAPELAKPFGMVTDAVWIDFDGDGRVDLVTVGEWMSPQFFRNDGGQFTNITKDTHLPALRGWWFTIAAGDFDRDGRPDLIAGNLGLNYSYRTSSAARFGVLAGDFTGNRSTDIVLTQESSGVEYPYAGFDPLGREVYALGLKFPTYGAFANAPISQMLGASQLKEALHFQVDTFASLYLHNDGSGRFSATALPSLAQISPVRGIVPMDVDGDGNLDVVIAGNLYDSEPNTAHADAGNGVWLRGDGHGHFAPVPSRESGFIAPGNVTGLRLLKTSTGVGLIVANAGDSLQLFSIVKR